MMAQEQIFGQALAQIAGKLLLLTTLVISSNTESQYTSEIEEVLEREEENSDDIPLARLAKRKVRTSSSEEDNIPLQELQRRLRQRERRQEVTESAQTLSDSAKVKDFGQNSEVEISDIAFQGYSEEEYMSAMSE